MEISGVDKKINISVVKYIVKQKDAIVNELKDKIRLLNQQVEVLSKDNCTMNLNKHSLDNQIVNSQQEPEMAKQSDVLKMATVASKCKYRVSQRLLTLFDLYYLMTQ